MGGDGPDMENRDPTKYQEELSNIAFENVIAEPDPVHSIDCVWKLSFKCYTCTLSCCYKFLTVLCAIPAAFCWGCEFACLACNSVWCMGPYLRYYDICMSWQRKLNAVYIRACMEPVCETCSIFFSKINK